MLCVSDGVEHTRLCVRDTVIDSSSNLSGLKISESNSHIWVSVVTLSQRFILVWEVPDFDNDQFEWRNERITNFAESKQIANILKGNNNG